MTALPLAALKGGEVRSRLRGQCGGIGFLHVERMLVGEEFVEDHAERINIGGWGNRFPPNLLRVGVIGANARYELDERLPGEASPWAFDHSSALWAVTRAAQVWPQMNADEHG